VLGTEKSSWLFIPFSGFDRCRSGCAIGFNGQGCGGRPQKHYGSVAPGGPIAVREDPKSPPL
jgi:hypothetical protein